MKKNSLTIQLFNKIKSIFLNGLLTLLPVTITYLLLKSTFNLVKGWLAPLHDIRYEYLSNYPKVEYVLAKIPHIEFLLVLGFVFLFGLVLKLFILKAIIRFVEDQVILKLPLIRPIYAGIKQIAHGLTTQDQHSLNKVVILEFPSAGVYSIGFLTGQFPKELSPDTEKQYFNIYVPTTPNPTTGFFVILAQDKFKEIDLSRQEAMTIIISGGIIKPKASSKV